MEDLIVRLENAVTRLEKCSGKSKSGIEVEDVPEYVDAYDAAVIQSPELKKYMDLSATLGGLPEEQSKFFYKAVTEISRSYLIHASKFGTPLDSDTMNVYKPMSEAIESINKIAETNRGSNFFNHLMMVKEGAGAVSWIAVSPKPVPFVKECIDQQVFYGNRVLKNNPDHKEWMRSYGVFLNVLKTYIEEWHKSGLFWVGQTKAKSPPSSSSSPPSAGPPPPPPPAVVPPTATQPPTSKGDQKAALFAELNVGMDITQGLRKVTDDMKTHKNPTLREKPPVAPKPSAMAKPPAKPAAAAPVSKPPQFALRNDKKWDVEYQGETTLTIDNPDMKHAVYIFKCEKTTIIVKKKINSITIDNCNRCCLVLDDVVGSVDIINCRNVKAQVLGNTALVNIDKSDSSEVYLSDKCYDTQIVTAKSAATNILFPSTKEEGDFVEFPLPEQFISVFDKKKFKFETTASESV